MILYVRCFFFQDCDFGKVVFVVLDCLVENCLAGYVLVHVRWKFLVLVFFL